MTLITGIAARNVLLVLVLIVGAGNLLASRLEVDAQARQGRIAEARICTTLARLAALKPPAGSAVANPSRSYEQKLHATLDQLGPDLGCR